MKVKIQYYSRCSECQKPFLAEPVHKKTCGDECSKKRQKRIGRKNFMLKLKWNPYFKHSFYKNMANNQKNSKDYRKKRRAYEAKYREKNRNLLNFRAVKISTNKRLGDKLGEVYLASYLLKKQIEGKDVSNIVKDLVDNT